jgi:hypothetical protein
MAEPVSAFSMAESASVTFWRCGSWWRGPHIWSLRQRGPETQVLRAKCSNTRHGRIVSDRHGYPLVWLRIEEKIGKCSEIGTCSVMGGSTPKPEASPPNTNPTMPIRHQLTPINDNPRTGVLQALPYVCRHYCSACCCFRVLVIGFGGRQETTEVRRSHTPFFFSRFLVVES